MRTEGEIVRCAVANPRQRELFAWNLRISQNFEMELGPSTPRISRGPANPSTPDVRTLSLDDKITIM